MVEALREGSLCWGLTTEAKVYGDTRLPSSAPGPDKASLSISNEAKSQGVLLHPDAPLIDKVWV